MDYITNSTESVSCVSVVPLKSRRVYSTHHNLFMCLKTEVTEVQFQKTCYNKNKQKQDLL